MAVPDLSFSSDVLRTAAQYVDETATCIEATPPTGNPYSHVYTQQVSRPINDLNDEETATQGGLRATHSDMLETLQVFEGTGNTTASSFSASNEE